MGLEVEVVCFISFLIFETTIFTLNLYMYVVLLHSHSYTRAAQ